MAESQEGGGVSKVECPNTVAYGTGVKSGSISIMTVLRVKHNLEIAYLGLEN